MKKIINRFYSYVDQSGTGCFNWNGDKDIDGYGRFYIKGNTRRAHRVVWAMHHGEIPKGLFVLHKCDNPSCVKVDHLFIGTHKDNMDDMYKKKRGFKKRGQDHGLAKLSESDVSIIRTLLYHGKSMLSISNKFNVSASTIRRIKTGETWSWLKSGNGVLD